VAHMKHLLEHLPDSGADVAIAYLTVAPEKGAKMAGTRAPALRLLYGQL